MRLNDSAGLAKSFLRKAVFAVLPLLFAAFAHAAESEISVVLKLDATDYVEGERIRGVIELHNVSPETLSVGHEDSKDYLFVEAYISGNMEQLEKVGAKPFTGRFKLKPNSKTRLETHLGDHYALRVSRRYLARPVLVHAGKRYEGQYVAFDIVPGMEISSSLQTFANNSSLSRVFKLVHWSRKSQEHVFLKAHDEGMVERSWETRDLGLMMKITKPVVSILPSGKVIVLHRYGPDHFMRSEYWSMQNNLEFVGRELIQDPETAGQMKVQELYDKAGGIKPVERPWWKFW